MTSPERIRARIKTGEHLQRWRRKTHAMRAIVAGDYSSLGSEGAPQNEPRPAREGGVDRRGVESLYDLMVHDFEEGTSNKILQTVKTLLMQVSYKSPEIEFEDATDLEASMNALYLKRRMGARPGGCEVVHHMRLALVDYLIGGLGWVWAGVDGGQPIARFVDSLDLSWDLDAKLITDVRWVAVHTILTAGEVAELYGAKYVAREMEVDHDAPGELWRERLVQLAYYWDIDGETGTHAVFRSTSGFDLDDEPIEHVENPHYLRVDDLEQPFLPLLPIYYFQLPSVRYPMSPVEMMIAAQMGLREAERNARAITKLLPFVDVAQGSYEEGALEELEDGVAGAMITRRADHPPATYIQGPDIPPNLMRWIETNKQELVAMGGANPYASGNKVDGISFASEVSAIEGAAGLTASAIAGDHAAHWQRVARAMLANGANYDALPMVLVMDSTPMTFGIEDPIGQYLRPDAHAQVAEDQLTFASKDKRIGAASMMLDQAIKVAPLVGAQTVIEAYKALLVASGTRDVSAHLQGAGPQAGGSPMDASAQAETGQEQTA